MIGIQTHDGLYDEANKKYFTGFTPEVKPRTSLPYILHFADLNRREFFLFLPFVFAIFWMGIYPEIFLDAIHCSVSNIIQHGKLD